MGRLIIDDDQRRRVHRSIVARIIGAALALITAMTIGESPVRAQSFVTVMRSSTDISEGDGVSRAEFAAMIDTLELDESQRALVEALYEGYRAALQAAVEANNSRREVIEQQVGADENGNWDAVGHQLNELRREWAKEQAALAQAFFTDAQALLRNDQQDNWARFERDHRRRTTLNQSASLPGEGVDVIELLESIESTTGELSTLETLSNTLDQYTLQLDPPLIARNLSLREVSELVRESAERPESMNEDMNRIFERLARQRRDLKEINSQFVERIATQLTPASAAELREAFLRRCYPRIYRRTDADEYLDQIHQIKSLDESQLNMVNAIESGYRALLNELNQKLVAIEQHEEKEREESGAGGAPPMMLLDDGAAVTAVTGSSNVAWISMSVETGEQDGAIVLSSTPLIQDNGTGGDGGGSADTQESESPKDALHRRKRELVNNTINQLFALLTIDQQALAPMPDPEEKHARQIQRLLEQAITSGANREDVHVVEFTLSDMLNSDSGQEQ